MAEFERREASIERSIGAVAAADGRVRVTGRVIDVSESRIVVDDGSGSLAVTVPEVPPWVKVGGMIRVFGKVMATETGVELDGEVVQDMGKLDVELWKRVKDAELKQA